MLRLCSTLLLMCFWTAGPVWADQTLQVEDAWVREGPPTAQVLGGFMTLANGTDRPIRITEISSPDFERIEMHRSVTEDGVAKMVPQPSLTVPAGGDLVLAPGGYHLMLYEPKQPMRAGQRAQFILHIDSGQQIAAQAEVRAGMGHSMEHHHHH